MKRTNPYPRSSYSEVRIATENIYYYTKQIGNLRKDLREHPNTLLEEYSSRSRRDWIDIYIRCRQFWLYRLNKYVQEINDLYQNNPRF